MSDQSARTELVNCLGVCHVPRAVLRNKNDGLAVVSASSSDSGSPAPLRGRRAAVPASRRARRSSVVRSRAAVAVAPPSRAARTAVRPAARPARRAAKTPRRGVLRNLISLSAMTGVAALILATSFPASAFYSAEEAVAAQKAKISAVAAPIDTQRVTVNAQAASAAAEAVPIERDAYEAKSFVAQVASMRGNPNFSYSNNPNGTIQWPFATSSPISSGYGPRAVCSYCSSYHLGVDFTPGSGTPIQAVTAGRVSEVNIRGGALGNHVVIDHVINGQKVQSLYAHMQWGSVKVAVGQTVEVGTIVGAVGSTGNSTGAHLHLELHVDGTPVDPYSWLKANAN